MQTRSERRKSILNGVRDETGRPGLSVLRQALEEMKEREQRRKEFFGIISRVLFVAMAVVLLNIYVVRFATVSGASMEPTLNDGDVVICSPLGYKPSRGDIVVTELDIGSGDLVKRVIALPGDTVDINFDTGTVRVNNEVIDEPYINGRTQAAGDITFPVTVPEGRVFLLGDNRNNSVDSRRSEVGMVPESTLLGRVYLRIFPFDGIGIP